MINNIENIKTKFSKAFSEYPKIFQSPGRVNLICEHIDYNEGFFLSSLAELKI